MATLKNIKRPTWIRMGVGLSFLALLLTFFYFSNFRQWMTYERLRYWVEWARSHPRNIVFFYLFFAVGIMGLPITPFPVIGGVLCNFWVALPLNVLASTVGAWLSFLVARFSGRRFVEVMLKGKLKSFDKVTANQGFKTVLLIRIIGVPPFIVANYALGLSGITGRDFLLATMIGVLPWTTLVTYAAHSLWQAVLIGGEKGLMQALFKALLPLIIMSAVIVAAGLVVIYKKKRQRLEAKPK